MPPTGHLSGSCGPFSASAPDSHFLHNRPPRGHFSSPHCSSFSIDRSTVIALGGNQQIVSPAVPPHQVPQWNPTPVERPPPDSSEQAGEEFLRCIAANKPLPDYLKGDMAYNLAEAFKSANALKEAVISDSEFQKHVTRSKSHSRSRSHGRSRGRSRAKSRARSRSKSRAHSRSRGRNKSRTRGKSQARSKSRPRSSSKARSRSQSHGRSKNKSHVRHKSRGRRSKSRSSGSEKSHAKDKKRKRSPSQNYGSSTNSINTLKGNSLLEGLKLVMNSKELDKRLPALKDAILTIQTTGESKQVGPVKDEHKHQQLDSEENSLSLDNDSMLLPHDRVGSDFSWLQAQSQEVSTIQKADEVEDEESFLYGIGDGGGKQADRSSTSLFTAFFQIGDHDKLQKMDASACSSQQQSLQMTSSSLASADLNNSECENVKNILKSLGTADLNKIMGKMQGQQVEKHQSSAFTGSDPTAVILPALSNPNVRQALESLQSLIKATKEKRTKGDGSGTSLTSDEHKENDKMKREKQARISKMESLMKELEELLRQDGLGFLTPVIGFYCQKCEEFIGDLNCTEKHAAIHQQSNSSSKVLEKDTGDTQGHAHYFSNSSDQHIQPLDQRDHRDYGYHRDSEEHRNHRDHQRDWRDERDHRSKPTDESRGHRDRQENISLKDEMKKERMLITVSCGLTPPPNVRVKEEVNKEQASRSQHRLKVEETDSSGKKSPKDSREKGRKKDESSDESSDDNDKGKAPKKKKKEKKKKKRKKKEKEDKF